PTPPWRGEGPARTRGGPRAAAPEPIPHGRGRGLPVGGSLAGVTAIVAGPESVRTSPSGARGVPASESASVSGNRKASRVPVARWTSPSPAAVPPTQATFAAPIPGSFAHA